MPRERPIRELTRADIEGLHPEPMRIGIPHKSDLLLYRIRGEQVVLKGYGAKRGLCHRLLGLVCTTLEERALRALAGMEGVPQFRGRIDRCCLAVAHVPGRRARGSDPQLRGNEEFVRRLECIVQQMHARGVVHLDLRHRSNVRVAPDGQPIVLDFESALCFDPKWLVGRLAVRLLGKVDQLAVLKWQYRLCPHMLSDSQMRKARLLDRLSGWWTPHRFIRGLLDGPASRARELTGKRPVR